MASITLRATNPSGPLTNQQVDDNFTSLNTELAGKVTGVAATSPVASSGGTAPTISLSAGYGDTQNPYASKTTNYFLAAPNGTAGVPTFRAIVAADIPTLNQNTTGTAASITGTYSGSLTSSQVTTALGYTPYNSTNPNGYITGITSANVTTALGYTPYNSTNPSNYIASGGALGTPSSGTLTNATGLPISTGVSGLGTGVAAFLATPSSANLLAAVSDETGTGTLVFSASPTFTGTATIATAAITSATVSTAPSSANDVVNKTYSDSATQTLTNKRIQPRVLSAASSTTFSVNADSYDVAEMIMTGVAGTLAIAAPTGTPVNGQKLIYKLQTTNAQTYNWGAIFQGSTDLVLPTTSSGASKWDYYGFIYNSTATKWQLIAKMAGF